MTERPELFEPDLPYRRQEYGADAEEEGPLPEGVRLVGLHKFFQVEDGLFGEVLRLAEGGELSGELGEHFPGFGLRQLNLSETVPGQVKAWHLHARQDEIWVVPPTSRLIVGVLDVRRGSATLGVARRWTLGGGAAHALYIPRGVAHGLANPYPRMARILYLVNAWFDGSDEWRLPYGEGVEPGFWELTRG